MKNNLEDILRVQKKGKKYNRALEFPRAGKTVI